MTDNQLETEFTAWKMDFLQEKTLIRRSKMTVLEAASRFGSSEKTIRRFEAGESDNLKLFYFYSLI